jgi:hypothetical protein
VPAWSIVAAVFVLVGSVAWVLQLLMIRGWCAAEHRSVRRPRSNEEPVVRIPSSPPAPHLGPLELRTVTGAELDISREALVVTSVPSRLQANWVFDRSSVGSLRVSPMFSGALLRLYGHHGERLAVVFFSHRAAVVRAKLASVGWLTLLRP